MDRLDLDAELLSPDHTFAAIIALFADRLTDALDQEPELQGELQTRLLRDMARQLRAQLRATEVQTARIDDAAARLAPLDLTDLEQSYLRGSTPTATRCPSPKRMPIRNASCGCSGCTSI